MEITAQMGSMAGCARTVGRACRASQLLRCRAAPFPRNTARAITRGNYSSQGWRLRETKGSPLPDTNGPPRKDPRRDRLPAVRTFVDGRPLKSLGAENLSSAQNNSGEAFSDGYLTHRGTAMTLEAHGNLRDSMRAGGVGIPVFFGLPCLCHAALSGRARYLGGRPKTRFRPMTI